MAGNIDAPRAYGDYDLDAIVKRFPPTSDTILIDTHLTDETETSSRVFRIYRDVPTTVTRRATNTCWWSRGVGRSLSAILSRSRCHQGG